MKPRVCICGTEPVITTVYDDEADYDFSIVKCPECGRSSAKKFSDRKAIRCWNISTTRQWATRRNHGE